MSARKQDSKNLKINKKSNRDFIKAIKSEKESVAIKDVRTCLVSENIPFLPQTYKIHLFENDSIKKQTDVNELCLLYTSPSPRDGLLSRMPSSA